MKYIYHKYIMIKPNTSLKELCSRSEFSERRKSSSSSIMSTCWPTAPEGGSLHFRKMLLKPVAATAAATITTTTTTTSKCNNNHHHHSTNQLIRENKTMTTLIVLLLTLAHVALSQHAVVESSSFNSDNNNNSPSNSITNQLEIPVQPFSQVRIECKLPQTTSSGNRFVHWLYQPTTSGKVMKPNVFCYESKCNNENMKRFGVQLDIDQDSGVYDLVINNVTYELNDGIYYCDHTDFENNQTISREIRLIVLIPPAPPTISPLLAVTAREGQEYQLSCVSSNGGNPEPNITWYRNNQLLTNTQGINKIQQFQHSNGTTASLLSLMPTLEDHQAVYKCLVTNRAMTGIHPYVAEHRLQVEYAPRITVGPTNPLKVLQDSQVLLSCSIDANPPVKGIKWFKDGRFISHHYNYTILKATESGVYSCQADNGIAPNMLLAAQSGSPISSSSSAAGATSFGGFFNSLLSSSSISLESNGNSRTSVEAQLHLQVLYPPIVHIKPSKLSALTQSEQFTLNCIVDSSPAPYEFLWTKMEDPTFRRVTQVGTIEFQAITASDAGNYTCTATNRLEPSILSSASMQQQTTATVLDRSGSASFVVNVLHPPGIAEIILGHNGETEQGHRTQIQCRAKPPGYPEPHYRFWKYVGGNSLNNNNNAAQQQQQAQVQQQQKYSLTNNNKANVFNINSPSYNDEGRYGCLAINELGQSSEADGELIVNEPPRIIIDDSTIRNNNDNRLPGDKPYSITIRGQAKPEPKITWYHRSPIDGRKIELSLGNLEMQTKFLIETNSKQEQLNLKPRYNIVTTLLFKQPLEIDDRGLYFVEFNNGLSKTAIQEFQLHINHKPIPAPKNQPIISPQSSFSQSQLTIGSALSQQELFSSKAGFDLGASVNLTCRVSAYPKPECDWYNDLNNDKPINFNARYKITMSNPKDDIWESSLTFASAQESDYGKFLCVCANRDSGNVSDSLRQIIILTRKTQPDPPTQLEAIDSTQDSIVIQWIPGFDGGFPNQNHFLVQYALDDGSGMSLGKRFPLADQGQGVVVMPSTSSSSSSYHHLNDRNHDQLSSILLSDSNNGLDSYQQAAGTSSASAMQQQLDTATIFPKLYDCLSMNPCTINQLLPRQNYIFRIRAKNPLGSSNFSDELYATTRANTSLIPKIQDASFDTKNNYLHFRIESNSDYPLHNLNARIEIRSFATSSSSSNVNDYYSSSSTNQQAPSVDINNSVQEISSGAQSQQQQQQSVAEWRQLSLVGPLRQEKVEAYLNMPNDVDQLRITLCSRASQSADGHNSLPSCGPEFVVSMKTAASSFLQDQAGGFLSYSIIWFIIVLSIVVALFAKTINLCCLVDKKGKKVDKIERVVEGSIDNKPISNGLSSSAANQSMNNGAGNNGLLASNGALHHHMNHHMNHQKGSHGSTTSTNSTSIAAGNAGTNTASSMTNGLQSMDSINNVLNGLNNGSSSDHSSDHSRQAKLDSMLPPNYNNYADRATILMEQQQLLQQQQQQQQQQQGLLSNALLGVTSQQQLPSPMMGNNGALNHFSYGHMLDVASQQQQQQQPLSLDGTGLMLPPGSMGAVGMPLGNGVADLQQQQQHMWSTTSANSQQMVDNYNQSNYNALSTSNGLYAVASAQQQQQQSLDAAQSMIDPTYGSATTTAAAVAAANAAAIYDNNANSNGPFQSYMEAFNQQQEQQYQQAQRAQHQYQQDIANAQQQMYGTLTRNNLNNNGYNNNNNNNINNNSSSNNSSPDENNLTNQQLIEQQYATSNGLSSHQLPLPPPPPIPPQESDYGTTGGVRNGGRVIREIIV